MKHLQIVLSIFLPLCAGLLHHEIRETLATGKWATILGFLLGYNLLFSLAALIGVIICGAKKWNRAAWHVIVYVTIASCTWSLAAKSLEVRMQKMGQDHQLSLVQQWQTTKGGGTDLEDLASIISKCNVTEYYGGKSSTSVVDGIYFKATLTNKSTEKISFVVIDYYIKNKKLDVTILTKRLMFPFEVFPTASVSMSQGFAPQDYSDTYSFDEIQRATAQLGENSKWGWDLVGFIPESLLTGTYRKDLRIDCVLKKAE